MMRDIPEGTVVDDRYRVLDRLGSGGMADVYCAEDQQLGRRVALKLLHRRFAEDTEFLERFRREASSAAGLQHPHVVAIYDRGEWDGTSYIAMEYLEGRTLKDLIVAEAPLDPIRAIDLVVQVLRAARFAHKRGIIHRDLKPHNVMIDAEGRAKVADFGIARAGASDMTQTGSMMGTAQYLSPEQAQGLVTTPESDLYSVGIVLYELLTGRLPFDGESAVTIALKQVNETPPPPSAHNAAVTPELESIVLRALEKDPVQRFRDADEFIAALDRARGNLAAGPPEAGATAVFAATAGAAVAPLGADPPLVPTYPTPMVDAVVASERDRRVLWGLLAALVIAAAVLAVYLVARPDDKPVPNVVGKPVAAGIAILHNAGFETRVERNTADAPRNTIIRQDPQPGDEVSQGETVTLQVSDGPGSRAVPDVVDKGRRTARRELTKAGFKVRERRETSDTIRVDRVISTTPDAGSQLEIGSTVTVMVSSGKEQVRVPDVVGSSRESARDDLEAAKLKVSVSEQESDQAPGTVLSQDPAGGTEVDSGTTVTIAVAKESAEVEVPDVTGLSAAEAVNRLANADLVPNQVVEEVTSVDEDDVVLSQSPTGGRKVKKNSRITIKVGRFTPDVDPEPEPAPVPSPDPVEPAP